MLDRRDFLKVSALSSGALVLPPLELTGSNRIVEENSRPGTDRWRLYSQASNREVEGFASATSVNVGETIRFYVHSNEPSFRLQIFRLGWYGGLGGRAMGEAIELPGLVQDVPPFDPITGMAECHWQPSHSFEIPHDWVSGGYLAKLSAPISRKERWIPFVVRDDSRFSDLLFQSSVTTGHAYNNWGGKSLYAFNSTGSSQAVKVSMNRPHARGGGAGDFVSRWEYNMIRFLEREGFDVRYMTNVDTHANPWMLATARAFLSVGHDEYWSWEMRDHVTAARDRGVHLGFFSANTCYWKIRFEPDADGQPHRTIVAYKESAMAQDPLRYEPRKVTNTWRHEPTSLPEEELIGVQYVDDQIDGDIVVADASHWAFRDTGLRSGDRLPGLLGYEVDRTFGRSPPGIEILARSPYVRQDNGVQGFSEMTFYSTPGGAGVFATGSIQWSWGVDDYSSEARPSRRNPAAEQVTRNVLRRFTEPPPWGRRRAVRI